MFLLLSSLLALIVGWVLHLEGFQLASQIAWGLGGATGVIPSIKWIINSISQKQYGSDLLALIATIATLADREFLAASVISLMLATGRLLEKWAAGKADRELQKLISRIPQRTHLLQEDGTLNTITV